MMTTAASASDPHNIVAIRSRQNTLDLEAWIVAFTFATVLNRILDVDFDRDLAGQ